MCGIIGLLIKKDDQQVALGEMMEPMFACMSERGPDSGGMAVFGKPVEPNNRRFNLFVPNRSYDWQRLLSAFQAAFAERGGQDARLDSLLNHGVLTTSVPPREVKLRLGYPGDRSCRSRI